MPDMWRQEEKWQKGITLPETAGCLPSLFELHECDESSTVYEEQKQMMRDDTSYFQPPRDYAARRFPTVRSNRPKTCQDHRCVKRDFHRAPHLQAVMERIEQRRNRDREIEKRRKEQEQEQREKIKARDKEGHIEEVLEVLAKYDNILQNLVKKNSRLRAYRKGLTNEIPTDSSCSTEQVLNDLDEVKMFKTKLSTDHAPLCYKSNCSSQQISRLPRQKQTPKESNSPKSRSSRNQYIPNISEEGENKNGNDDIETIQRKARIRYLKERFERRKANGLHPNNREFLEVSRKAHIEHDKHDNTLEPQCRVDDMHKNFQELRDSKETMRGDLQQIKHRYLERHNDLKMKYSGSGLFSNNGYSLGYHIRKDGVIIVDDNSRDNGDDEGDRQSNDGSELDIPFDYFRADAESVEDFQDKETTFWAATCGAGV
jgi:hypothetical protein